MPVSPDELKAVMSRIAATVTVVTASNDDTVVGLTMTAFLSVSADPPIVLICIDKSAGSLQTLLNAGGFTVNVMPEGTEEAAIRFATRGADKFAETDWAAPASPTAGPVLTDALAHLECSMLDTAEMGDHWVIYGSVDTAHISDGESPPLVWLGRAFAKLAT